MEAREFDKTFCFVPEKGDLSVFSKRFAGLRWIKVPIEHAAAVKAYIHQFNVANDSAQETAREALCIPTKKPNSSSDLGTMAMTSISPANVTACSPPQISERRTHTGKSSKTPPSKPPTASRVSLEAPDAASNRNKAWLAEHNLEGDPFRDHRGFHHPSTLPCFRSAITGKPCDLRECPHSHITNSYEKMWAFCQRQHPDRSKLAALGQEPKEPIVRFHIKPDLPCHLGALEGKCEMRGCFHEHRATPVLQQLDNHRKLVARAQALIDMVSSPVGAHPVHGDPT